MDPDCRCKTIKSLQSSPLLALPKVIPRTPTMPHEHDAHSTAKRERERERDREEEKSLITNLGHPEEDGVMECLHNHLDRHFEPSF